MSICQCKFKGAGLPMDNSECTIHTQTVYGCDRCSCNNYKPTRAPIKYPDERIGYSWAICTCGHIAQDHNKGKETACDCQSMDECNNRTGCQINVGIVDKYLRGI